MTHRERWLSTVCDLRTDGQAVGIGGKPSAAPRQPGSFRVVMTLMSMYADYDTGTNARPSLRLLQDLSHYKHATVRDALTTAEGAGYIAGVGTWTPSRGGDPVTVWQLGYPGDGGIMPWNYIEDDTTVSPPSGVTEQESVSPPSGTTVGESTQRSHRDVFADASGESTERQSVSPLSGTTVSPPSGVRPPLPPDPKGGREEEEEEESASAPPPDGGAHALHDEALQGAIFDVLRQRWENETPVISNRSRLRLADLLAAGWNHAAIVAGVNTIPRKPRNPALLLEAHLKRMLDDHQPQDFDTRANTTTGDNRADLDPQEIPDDVEVCPHGFPRSLPRGSCLHCTEFQQQMRAAIQHAERNGFTLNVGRRDEYGEREVNLIAANVLLNYEIDEHDQPYSPCVSIKHPNEQQLQLLVQCHGEIPQPDERGWRRAVIQPFAPFPQVLSGLVEIFALPDRRTPHD